MSAAYCFQCLRKPKPHTCATAEDSDLCVFCEDEVPCPVDVKAGVKNVTSVTPEAQPLTVIAHGSAREAGAGEARTGQEHRQRGRGDQDVRGSFMKVNWTYITEPHHNANGLEGRKEYWTLTKSKNGNIEVGHEWTDKYGDFSTNDNFKEGIFDWQVIAFAPMEYPEKP